MLCRFPFIIGIAICQGEYTKNYFPRYTHHLLQEVPEFVLNIPHDELREAITLCGSVSGKDVDKFQAAGLTPQPSLVVRPPGIAECPVNLECQVRQVIGLGSHDLFLGETVAVHTAVAETKVEEDLTLLTLTANGEEIRKLSWRSLPVWFSP